MKRIFFTILAVVLIIASVKSFAQIIPNTGFEAWSTVASYENPDFWQTGNAGSVQLGGTPTVIKSTDSNGGQFSAQLQTSTTTAGFNFPGIAACGNINVVGIGNVSFTGGFPCNVRYAALTGYYKYTSGNGIDKAVVTAFLFKRNGAVRDTVAIATKTFTQDTTWGMFVDSFVYKSGTMTPDSALIIITSSENLGFAQLGSVLNVDDLLLTGVIAGVKNVLPEIVNINVYPNPATETVNFSISNIKNAKTLSIYDILGKKIKTVEIVSALISVSTEGLNNSLYFYQLADSNNQIISTGKFSVKK